MKLFEINTDVLIDRTNIETGSFDPLEEAPWAGKINVILIPLLMFVSVLLFLSDKAARRVLAKRPALPLFILITALVLIATISTSAHSTVTITRAGSQLLFLTCIVALIYSIHDKPQIYITVGLAFLTSLLIDLALYLTITTGFTSSGAFIGYHSNQNIAGNHYGLATMIFIFLAITRKNPIFLVACAASASLVLFSESRTTMSAIGIFIVLSLFYKYPIVRAAIILSTLIATVTVSVYFSLGQNDSELFTGRGEIWNFLSSHIWQKPFLGHGFSSFWDIGPQSINVVERDDFIGTINTGHNGFIDLLLGTGLLGFVVFNGFLFFAALLLIQLDMRFFLAHYLFIAFLVSNITETYFFYYQNIMWLMLILMIGAAYTDSQAKHRSRRRQRSQSDKQSGFV